MKPVMMLSMPNSGTDWFMREYCAYSTRTRYCREFFNEDSNSKYRMRLRDAFGCEVSCVDKMATPWEELPTEEVYGDTWCREQYDVTKEIGSQFKVGFFVPRFDCFLWIRPLTMSLPPRRDFIRRWGIAFMESLESRRRFLDGEISRMVDVVSGRRMGDDERMVSGYYIMTWKLLWEGERHGLPVVRYDRVVLGGVEDVRRELNKVPAIRDMAGLLKGVMGSRRHVKRDFGSLGVWSIVKELSAASGEKYADVICPLGV